MAFTAPGGDAPGVPLARASLGWAPRRASRLAAGTTALQAEGSPPRDRSPAASDAGRGDPAKGSLSSWLFALGWHTSSDRVCREAIRELQPARHTAPVLAFFGGQTHVTFSEQLGIPLGTAGTRIRTALVTLCDILGPSLPEAGSLETRWITGPTAS